MTQPSKEPRNLKQGDWWDKRCRVGRRMRKEGKIYWWQVPCPFQSRAEVTSKRNQEVNWPVWFFLLTGESAGFLHWLKTSNYFSLIRSKASILQQRDGLALLIGAPQLWIRANISAISHACSPLMLPLLLGEERRAAVPRLGCTEVTKGPDARPGIASSPEAQHRAVMEEELKKGQKQWPLTLSLPLGPNDLFLPQPSQQSLFSHHPTSLSLQYFQSR